MNTHMKKGVLISIIYLLSISSVFAQDPAVKEMQAAASKTPKPAEKDGWTRKGIFSLNINQGALSNWAAGGEQNTFGFNGLLNYNVDYRKGKNTWDNYFDIALGFQNATSYSLYRKTDDRIDITSKYGRQLNKNWYSSFLMNFNTQALPGYTYTDTLNTKISNLMTPGKLILTLGLDFKPTKEFSLFISPVAVRLVFKSDEDFYKRSEFGVDSAKKVNTEFGAYITAKYNKALNSWATYTGRLDLYSNYIHNPENIDILFNNLLSLKFNKWLGVNLSVDVLYDDDVLKKTQLKEILGIGLTLKL